MCTVVPLACSYMFILLCGLTIICEKFHREVLGWLINIIPVCTINGSYSPTISHDCMHCKLNCLFVHVENKNS